MNRTSASKKLITRAQCAALSAALTFSFLYAARCEALAAFGAFGAAALCAVVAEKSGGERFSARSSNVIMSVPSIFAAVMICENSARAMSLGDGGAMYVILFLLNVMLAVFLALPRVCLGRYAQLVFLPLLAIFIFSLLLGGKGEIYEPNGYRGLFILSCSGAFITLTRQTTMPADSDASPSMRAEAADFRKIRFRAAGTAVGALVGAAAYAAAVLIGANMGMASALALWTVNSIGAAGALSPAVNVCFSLRGTARVAFAALFVGAAATALVALRFVDADVLFAALSAVAVLGSAAFAFGK